jgi:chromosomal replication initiator protein
VATPHSSRSDWDTFHHILRDQITPSSYDTWIEPLDTEFRDGTLHLVAPTEFHFHWVNDKFLSALQRSAMAVFGDDVAVELSADPQPETSADPSPIHEAYQQQELPVAARSSSGMVESRLIPKYTFENFVVGQSNRFSHAAALAVAEQPGSHYNPLFIYADAGLGKTHLLHAVGHHRKELDPGAVIKYVSSEQFFNDFINGIRRKRMDEFKSRYRSSDVLLLDDVQFFEGKEQILEEFFHTFNSLYEAGKQLVISSDRHPKHLSTLEDRLRSRFEWGLLTDIQSPDVETRLAILRKNAEFAPMPVPRDVLEFIAVHVSHNIRELEGALTRVTAYAALTGERIGLAMANEVLADVVGTDANAPPTADSIIDITADYYDLSLSELTGPSRKQPLARSRQIAMYLCREHTDLSLPKIGAAFGGRDHTTVLHAVEKVKDLMQRDKEVFSDVTHLSQKLRTS